MVPRKKNKTDEKWEKKIGGLNDLSAFKKKKIKRKTDRKAETRITFSDI